jgi:hypothetical protein
MSREGALM